MINVTAKRVFDINSNVIRKGENGYEVDEFFGFPIQTPKGLDVLSVVNGDHRVTKKHKINIVLDYPLDHEYTFEMQRAGGWTLHDILLEVRTLYLNIYRNPDKYGVWGHGIGDLMVERMFVSKDRRTITFFVGS